MADRIRVGIVGANPGRGWALAAHLPGLVVLPNFEITAVATTREESAKETAARYGIAHSFGDPAELIAHPDVDVVSISVKVPFHYALTRAALEHDKHVFVEWPLGANSAEAIELAELARSRGVQHLVGLQGRKSPLVNYVHDLVADGYVGELLFASLAIEGGGRGGPTIPEERIWAMDRANGATGLSISGGHEIDVLRRCVGELGEVQATVAVQRPKVTVVETGAVIDVSSPDVILAVGTLATGGQVTIAIQGGLPKGSGARLAIHGTDGTIVVSGPGGFHLSDDSATLVGARGSDDFEPLVVPARYATVPDAVPVGPARNVAGLYLALGEAIDHGAPLDPDFDAAVELHALLDTLESSSSSGTRQRVGA